MPNWCMTNYCFTGNAHHIKKFHDALKEWTSKPGMENGFGDNWLGNILYHAGLGDLINCDDNSKRLRCRGTLYDLDYEYGNDYFYLTTETAWCPMPMMFQKVIDHLGYDIVFAYQSEEPNMGYYEIYDPHNIGTYDGEDIYVDTFFEDEEKVIEKYPFLDYLYDFRYMSMNEFNDFLKENGFKSVQELEELELPNENDYISVHFFERVDELCC